MHIAVLQNEIKNIIIDLYKKNKINNAIDFTFGAGGHSKIILENSSCSLIAIDRDPTTNRFTENIIKTYGNRFNYYNDVSNNIKKYSQENSIDFILGDLGLSQMQLNEDRGFSYQSETFLNMQMGVGSLGSLDSFLKTLSEYKIGEIIRNYGEEASWRKIAKNIKEYSSHNSIKTTLDLKNIIAECFPKNYKFLNKTLSRCFQAFRIFINQELEILEETLNQIEKILKPGGMVAIITFHSLEDRIVKTFFKKHFNHSDFLIPTEEEISQNSQARSAKLRLGFKKI